MVYFRALKKALRWWNPRAQDQLGADRQMVSFNHIHIEAIKQSKKGLATHQPQGALRKNALNLSLCCISAKVKANNCA